MRAQLTAVIAILLVAGPAAAQGTFNPGGKGSTWKPATPERKAPSWPALPSDGAPAGKRPGSGGVATEPTKASGFKPYEPFKPGSVYGPDGKRKK